MIRNAQTLLARIRAVHAAIRDEVIQVCERSALEQLSAIVAEQAGDTIFAIDRVSETVLLEHFATLGNDWSFVLIAEGLGENGLLTFPPGIPAEQAELRIIIDPIDGTRGLMYQKRSAWILTGVAPNRGPGTNLSDIELAVQTEIPLVKQYLSDTLWAIAEQGVTGERLNRLTRETVALVPHPSQAKTIAQGFGGIARFFPGTRAELALVDDAVVERILGPVQEGRVQAFEDQYLSSGGQLYELMMGHDRWIADIRPLAERWLRAQGKALGMCCHPYDMCTELLAREAGVVVTDEQDQRLHCPLDVTSNVTWMGYANTTIYRQVAPVLHELLVQRGLL